MVEFQSLSLDIWSSFKGCTIFGVLFGSQSFNIAQYCIKLCCVECSGWSAGKVMTAAGQFQYFGVGSNPTGLNSIMRWK